MKFLILTLGLLTASAGFAMKLENLPLKSTLVFNTDISIMANVTTLSLNTCILSFPSSEQSRVIHANRAFSSFGMQKDFGGFLMVKFSDVNNPDKIIYLHCDAKTQIEDINEKDAMFLSLTPATPVDF